MKRGGEDEFSGGSPSPGGRRLTRSDRTCAAVPCADPPPVAPGNRSSGSGGNTSQLFLS
jgi:hypothetical protein